MDKVLIRTLLERYLRGESSLEEKEKVHRWYARLQKKGQLHLSEEEKYLLENKLWENIRKDMGAGSPPIATQWLSWITRAGIAAGLVLVLGLGWYYQKERSGVPSATPVAQTATHSVTRMNDGSSPMEVVLSDGSRITLSPGSVLDYPEHFTGESREVHLKGDAFFDIVSKPGQPFLVHNGKLITQVLGTQFWIRTNTRNKTLEVEVVSGKVSVFENAKLRGRGDPEASNGVLLTPNQRVTYYPDKGYLLASVVNEPLPILEDTQPALHFDNVDLEVIAGRLVKKYGIEILFANDELGKCTFTGDLNGLSLYNALELVCRSVGAEYKVTGTRILMDGTGCD